MWPTMSEFIEARIIVTKTVTEQDVILNVESEPEDLAAIDGAGMLAMALDTWMSTDHAHVADED